MDTMEKLSTLVGAAKYDVSCASSGVTRKNPGGTGNTRSFGICHSWSADGRCISLLKILLSNNCIFDCRYCANRCSNDIPRASFLPRELAELTMQFYRRNYIEGLFLSSAVEKTPDYTMEKMLQALRLLRHEYQFNGYIHVKVIPGSDPQLIYQTGLLADRMSVNIEQASEESLRLLAPQKSFPMLFSPMKQLQDQCQIYQEERKTFRNVPRFIPGGQSTQMIIGAGLDNDLTILQSTQNLYRSFGLKRVYFSAYVPVNQDSNLPAVASAPPLLREHRLYQSDWLLRFYHFGAEELLDENHTNLDMDLDPKTSWALRHPEFFPLEINRASYEELLRVPGIGPKSAARILSQRRMAAVSSDEIKKLGVVFKRAQFFITCKGIYASNRAFDPQSIRRILTPKMQPEQMTLF